MQKSTGPCFSCGVSQNNCHMVQTSGQPHRMFWRLDRYRHCVRGGYSPEMEYISFLPSGTQAAREGDPGGDDFRVNASPKECTCPYLREKVYCFWQIVRGPPKCKNYWSKPVWSAVWINMAEKKASMEFFFFFPEQSWQNEKSIWKACTQ